MPTRRRPQAVVLVVLAAILAAAPRRADKPPAGRPWYVDDADVVDRFVDKAAALAKAGKCLAAGDLGKRVAADATAAVALARPAADRLDPEDVFDRTVDGVLLLGSVRPSPDDDGKYLDERVGTAWAATPDGVLVTSRHLFEDVADDEAFVAVDRAGNAYPLTAVLAADAAADVAVVKVDAAGLKPLPVAADPPRVGAWVGVVGHPGDRYWTFTQGAVGRYVRYRPEGKPAERWMAVTAEFAAGSSGSPVVDRTGAVVGMAALTDAIDAPPPAGPPKDGDKDKGDEPAPGPADAKDKKGDRPDGDGKGGNKGDPPNPPADQVPAGSSLQMVVKLVVPLPELRRVLRAD